jgi:hypothetical protein
MMDFWHCHKPDEHHLHDHTHEVGGQKGYAAGNRLKAASGVGFVDLTGFLVKEQDWEGAKVRLCFPFLLQIQLCAPGRKEGRLANTRGILVDTIALD